VAGGGAGAWPLTARAQRAMPVVGFLQIVAAGSLPHFLAAFRQGLAELGYVERQHVSIEYRWAEGRVERLPELAAELVSRDVSVIATPGNMSAALAAKAATNTIPIVFAVPEDPVRFGLVASLARPSGNATGINYLTTEVLAKRLGLLHEVAPKVTRIAVLVNPTDVTNAEITVKEVEAAAQALGLRTQIFNASTADEIDAAFAALRHAACDSLFVAPGAFFNSRRVQLATLAASESIPASYSVRDYAEVGGLMSYGTSIPDAFRQTGIYVGRILRGEKPADMPVLQASKFEFAINLRTARALGLEVTPTLLARADEVIE
jgi:putative ABC transport system substrate-binding protein